MSRDAILIVSLYLWVILRPAIQNHLWSSHETSGLKVEGIFDRMNRLDAKNFLVVELVKFGQLTYKKTPKGVTIPLSVPSCLAPDSRKTQLSMTYPLCELWGTSFPYAIWYIYT